MKNFWYNIIVKKSYFDFLYEYSIPFQCPERFCSGLLFLCWFFSVYMIKWMIYGKRGFNMVGYAYSVDYTCGYRYVLIKCYDCDDFSFVTDSMPYCIYRVCRTDGKVRLTYTSELYSGKRLSLKHINRIVNLLTLSEYVGN